MAETLLIKAEPLEGLARGSSSPPGRPRTWPATSPGTW